MGDRGNVQKQIRRTAKGRVKHHRVLDAGARDDIAGGELAFTQTNEGAGRATGQIQPHRLPGRGERGVRQRKPQRLAHYLRRGRGTEELTATAGRRARPAAQVRRFRQRNQAVGETRPQRLHRPGVFARRGRQSHSARHDHAGQIAQAGHGHQHRGQTFVARRDAEHARAQRQGTREPPENHGGVVTIRQAVKHAGGALGATVAGIRAEPRERNSFPPPKFLRRRLHEQSNFPVPGVITERDGLAVGRAHSSLGAED